MWIANGWKVMGVQCAFSSMPVAFGALPCREGDPIVHGGVAMLVLRWPKGEGLEGV